MTRQLPPHQLSPSERRTIVNKLFVERENLGHIVAAMDKLREKHREGGEMASMLIVGDPGVGKSTLLRRYAEANPVVEIRTSQGVLRTQPVVYVELDSDTTANMAAELILQAMMGTNAPHGAHVRTRLLPKQLELRRTELLIIDEFQHVAETGQKLTRNRTADWIKGITKKLRIPVVMAGMSTITPIVEDNWQLDTLSLHKFHIPAYDDSPDVMAGFREFLDGIDAQLPFLRRSDLSQTERSSRLHIASGGVLRHLGYVLSEAARNAIDQDAAFIGDHHFFWACDEIELHRSCQFNPFQEPPDGS